ncbi:MAG: PQQ-dependent sugar dehydrogenase [Deltaproteobacteria bacterium]|nr:PQQ-dependent sugar dehydrogenase [Deltaproteobacteria bacterium]
MAAAPSKPSAPPPSVASGVRLEVVGSGLVEPVGMAIIPRDARKRLFIVEKGGRVRVLVDGKPSPNAFLDLSARVSRGSEQGLLGLAFHPKAAENRRLFVNYTDRKGDTHVVELRVNARSPDRVDVTTEREILFVDQPYANHNGGHLAFGPDGKLYVGLGDGGSGGDPKGNAQNRASLLGKMLRIDVDVRAPRPEIIQVGLRNPWRYAFDRKTGDLYIADVGQELYEEINFLPARRIAGHNFGWNTLEGFHCYRDPACKKEGMTLPVLEYGHAEGCSITGGHVYRGKALPVLDGHYFYADYCTALLRSVKIQEGSVVESWDWKPVLDPKGHLSRPTSFGEDENGELYILSQDGLLFMLKPVTSPQ